MKTSQQIKHVNYNDIQFILGKSPNESKAIIAKALDIKEVNAKGIPMVKSSDKAPIDKIDFTIRSNSALDGSCYFEVIVDRFNKGIDMGQEFECVCDDILNDFMETLNENPIYTRQVDEYDTEDFEIDDATVGYIFTVKGMNIMERYIARLQKLGEKLFPEDNIDIQCSGIIKL